MAGCWVAACGGLWAAASTSTPTLHLLHPVTLSDHMRSPCAPVRLDSNSECNDPGLHVCEHACATLSPPTTTHTHPNRELNAKLPSYTYIYIYMDKTSPHRHVDVDTWIFHVRIYVRTQAWLPVEGSTSAVAGSEGEEPSFSPPAGNGVALCVVVRRHRHGAKRVCLCGCGMRSAGSRVL